MEQELKAGLEQHPYGALAVALGAGYVLGGGFFTPLTARIARFAVNVGLRAALIPLLKAQLSDLIAPADEKDAAPAPPGRSNPANADAA